MAQVGIEHGLYHNIIRARVVAQQLAQILLGNDEALASMAPARGGMMLYYALVFLVVALIAGALGVSGVAAVATNIAYVLFVIALVLFIVHLVTGRRLRTP
jgi:uncharacterized membrane protein YtjA (UPF0391 family)